MARFPSARVACLAVSILMMAAGDASAEAYRAMGLGLSTCAEWTAARRKGLDRAYRQWILGFLSGTGFVGPQDPLSDVEADEVWAWVDQFCDTHPLKDIQDAGAAFVHVHPGHRDVTH
jgi:hypothetical protein